MVQLDGSQIDKVDSRPQGEGGRESECEEERASERNRALDGDTTTRKKRRSGVCGDKAMLHQTLRPIFKAGYEEAYA